MFRRLFIMRVQEVLTNENKTRYVLIDKDAQIIIPVAKFLKFKDNSGASRNTLRAYCYGLKLFFEFLEQKNLTYTDIGIDDFAELVKWLQNPYQNVKVAGLHNPEEKQKRKARSINLYLDKVYGFYDYIMSHEDYSQTISERLKRQVSVSRSNFKGFLHHTLKNKTKSSKQIRLKVPKEKLKILTKDEIQSLIDACNNIKDKFLLALLYETGMRIGEVLSLHLSDIEPAKRKIHVRDRGELENGAEIKTVSSPRTLEITQQLADLYRTYLIEIHTDEVFTDFVFIKLSGKGKGQPLTYVCVQALFKRLKQKTKIDATAHMFRHTNLTELWRTKEMRPETLKLRAGHQNIQTTMQMYVHPSDEDLRVDWENAMRQKENNTEDC